MRWPYATPPKFTDEILAAKRRALATAPLAYSSRLSASAAAEMTAGDRIARLLSDLSTAMGMLIEKAVSDDGAGMRALAGGYANGRGH